MTTGSPKAAEPLIQALKDQDQKVVMNAGEFSRHLFLTERVQLEKPPENGGKSRSDGRENAGPLRPLFMYRDINITYNI